MICSIGTVSATDLNDNSTVEVISSVDDCISVDEVTFTNVEQSQEVASTNAATWDELKTACQSSGDKVITLTGQSYNANSQIVFGNSATIIGSSDSYITTNNPNLIPFFNSNSNLNITFLNVNFKDSNCNIFIQSAGNNELNNCIFSNITTGAGKTSVVYNTQGLMNLDNCTFTNCHTQYGTITNYGSNVRMNVDNCNFVNNNASVEPGAINNCGILNVTNSMFVGNNATWWAGAIHTHSNAQTRIIGSKFIKNHAGWNGGALFTYSKLEVYNSTFDENICDTTTGGGAIGSYNFGSSYNITIENCSFKNNKNTASGGNGGAITALNGGYLNVHGSNFTNNSADNGLAICAFNANYPNATGGVPFLQVYNNTFNNHWSNITENTVQISAGNYTFENNTFINCNQTIRGVNNTFINCTPEDSNLLKSLNIQSIRLNQPIVANPENNITGSQWAMAGYDAQNSGQSPYNGINTLKVLWSKPLALISSPIIDEEGNIYVVNGNTISSFYNNGTSRWNFGAWMLAGIALYNDYIIAPEPGNKLTIVNKTTGKEVSSNIWQLSSAFTPIVDSEGNIYVSHEYPYNGPGSVSGSHWVGVASYNNDTASPSYGYAFSASLIKLSKNPSYGKPGTISAPVLDKLGNVWVNTIEGIIGANIESGSNIFKISNAGTSGRPVVGDNNVVYCFGNNNVIFALNAGGIIWNTTVPDGIGKVLAIDNENNVLYTVNAKGMVYKIDSLTGNISEFYNIEATVSSAIMIGANGTLYLGDDKGTFWIIGSDGKLLDSCNFGSAIVGMPAMDKTGNIYIGTKNTFYVLTSKMESNISVDVQNINVGDNATIIATLPANATGNVTFTVNNKEYIVAIENGSAKLNVENLLSGTYDVLVRFMGDNNYLPSENNASFIVSKVPTNMNIAVDNINVGEDAVINITLPNEISNELVSVTIDGKSYTVLINNGKGSLILSNLVANSYPITAKYDGNYKYTEGENSTTLTVAKMSSAVNVTANNIKFGEEAVINIAVPNVSLGVATVVVNGKSYNVAIVDEKGVLNIYNLAAGDYNVDVTYLGDNKYLSSTNAANFTVSKVSDYNMTVDIADIVKGENATITVSVPEDGTGSVIVTINGTDYKGTVIKGIAKVIIPDLDEGSYKVVTFYTGDNKYDSMVVNGTITVNKNTITTLIMDDVVKYFGGSQKLIAKLVDGFGNPIANATVYFTINGGVYARITDENGTASIAIRLLPGEYKASALFNGTDDYDMAAVNASVLVKNTILGNDTTLYFRNGTQYVAKFLDSNGKALANTDVKFNINGVFYTRVTDENGIARLNIRLDPASYIITAYNPVTGEQKANEVTVLPRIIAEDLSMKYLDGSSFNATLVDGQGKAVAGVNITFNVNGVFYHRTTDANGVARLNIRLMPGDYIITSTYDKCWASNKITISA
ncbi:Ig-like domain repeat protein [uncultured Methanobrevibacter sp.]|uniref:Ig-like domain repeat protein n=1 Tax=uncultured Methanobrevibacter sp. TaxID=253161 RepID=UPI00258A4E75|nr:Ig-like domain repeat protein [uncultured Methanobrevibacter sp.]